MSFLIMQMSFLIFQMSFFILQMSFLIFPIVFNIFRIVFDILHTGFGAWQIGVEILRIALSILRIGFGAWQIGYCIIQHIRPGVFRSNRPRPVSNNAASELQGAEGGQWQSVHRRFFIKGSRKLMNRLYLQAQRSPSAKPLLTIARGVLKRPFFAAWWRVDFVWLISNDWDAVCVVVPFVASECDEGNLPSM
jgi:hypothetical protein